jgi:hypothetical protein
VRAGEHFELRRVAAAAADDADVAGLGHRVSEAEHGIVSCGLLQIAAGAPDHCDQEEEEESSKG